MCLKKEPNDSHFRKFLTIYPVQFPENQTNHGLYVWSILALRSYLFFTGVGLSLRKIHFIDLTPRRRLIH
jgi:hypothetical protein